MFDVTLSYLAAGCSPRSNTSKLDGGQNSVVKCRLTSLNLTMLQLNVNVSDNIYV